MRVEISAQANAMTVLELGLDFVLLAETAPVIQVALEDVALLKPEYVERGRFYGFFRRYDGGLTVRLGPGVQTGSDEKSATAGKEARKIFHKSGLS